MSHLALQSVWRSGSSAVRTPLTLLPVWLRLAYIHTIRYGLFVLYWEISSRLKPSLTWFAVSRSSGPFHTRQFASKLSVADVYESRHNKAAHQIKAHITREDLYVYYCVAQRLERSENALNVVASVQTTLNLYSVWCICFILRNFYTTKAFSYLVRS